MCLMIVFATLGNSIIKILIVSPKSTVMSVIEIEKEEITKYKFVSAEQNRTEELLATLQLAQRLGNEFKAKTTITFMTEEGTKKVTTTVWSLTGDYLQLKAGVLIPVRSIIDVSY